MKKTTFVFAALVILSACKKERTCTCTSTDTYTITALGQTQSETGTPSTKVTKYKKAGKDAQECISGELSASGTGVESGIPYTFTTLTKQDCSLK